MNTQATKRTKAYTQAGLGGMKVLVVGLARSGIAACNVLLDVGAVVKATDAKAPAELGTDLGPLRARGVGIELGKNSVEFARECGLIVVSPGVPQDTDLLAWARSTDRPVISEIELAWCLSDARFVAVTGTNGKTTTASLLGRILSDNRDKVLVGGNIGEPVSPMARGLDSDWIVVVEVSSFQLDTCVSFGPAVSVLLNITPDHLDRYATYQDYVRSKAKLFANQTPGDVAVLNLDDRDTIEAASGTRPKKLFFSLKSRPDEGAFVRDGSVVVRVGGEENTVLSVSDLRIPGPHNLANSLAATLAATVLGIRPEEIGRSISAFRGLEHRLEYVATIEGIDFVNDSKATNVDAMRVAIEASDRPVILIAGGRDKGGDFGPTVDLVQNRVKVMVALGEARQKLQAAFAEHTEFITAQSLEEAVESAFLMAQAGDVVLLSPGCASYDMFRDFEHRGKVFKQAVLELKREREA